MAIEATGKFSDSYEKISLFSRALSHPARVKITELLSERGEMTCGELTDQLPLSQATVSQHLKLLRECSMINMRKEGLKSIYSLNTTFITDAYTKIPALLNQLINPL